MSYGDYLPKYNSEDHEDDREHYTEWRENLYDSNMDNLKDDILKDGIVQRYIYHALNHEQAPCYKYLNISNYCGFSDIYKKLNSDFTLRFQTKNQT